MDGTEANASSAGEEQMATDKEERERAESYRRQRQESEAKKNGVPPI
jgi:hypothetical protein